VASPDTPVAAAAAPRRRTWVVVVAFAAVLAVLSPAVWLLSRPEPDAGVPLAVALAPTQAPSSPATAGPDDEPSRSATDASLDALSSERDPAPTRFQVPDLGIDAAVDAVGVEDDGSMVIPAEIARVGWYRFGPAPGAARGNAVVAGHVDAAGEGPGALFDLRGVEVGARITVTDESGEEHTYEVVSRETVTKDVLPIEQIFDRTGEHRLVVITCGGPFQPELRSYRDNVVVTAVPVAGA
jgi:sortase (surface protein transpeptidase)